MPKDEPIVRRNLEGPPEGQTDWKRVDKLTDEEIEAAIREDPDAAPICNEQWFEQAQLVIPPQLKHLWVQIDEDLMAWFRQQGKDWPARINTALREYVEARRRGGREPADDLAQETATCSLRSTPGPPKASRLPI